MDRRGGQDRHQSRQQAPRTVGETERPAAANLLSFAGRFGRRFNRTWPAHSPTENDRISVGHTVPLRCDRAKPLEELCVVLKRSGHEVEAKIDPTTAMCNSGCVYALAGGAIRLIPPWVRVGIHDVARDPNRNMLRSVSEAAGKRIAYERLRYYLREVGADEFARRSDCRSLKFAEAPAAGRNRALWHRSPRVRRDHLAVCGKACAIHPQKVFCPHEQYANPLH